MVETFPSLFFFTFRADIKVSAIKPDMKSSRDVASGGEISCENKLLTE